MLFIKKYGPYIIIIIIVLGFTFYPKKPNEIIVEKEIIKEVEPIISKIKVDIKGAIKKPGVYEMDNNTRVVDLISAAGGLKTSADTTNINLSKVLTDEMVVVVRTKEELIKKEVVIEYVEVACVIDDEEETSLININTSDVTLLDKLPGIGPAKALDIVNYRTTNGLFKAIEELKNVSGIGDSLYDQVKDLITI